MLPAQITVNSSGSLNICNKINVTNGTSILNILPIDNVNCLLGDPYNPMYYINSTLIYSGTNYIASDKRIKENFRDIESPLSKILKMEGWEYDLIPDSFDYVGTEEIQKEKAEIKKNRLGFVAQEIKEILPEAVRYDKKYDKYYIEYTAIIPVIVEAMKEQQTKIEEQQTTIEKLSDRVETLEGNTSNEKSATISSSDASLSSNVATLSQNIPNPFSSSTRIDIYLPTTTKAANLYIYNMQGAQVKSYTITNRGNTSVTIDGYTLEAGMYLYTLIADGKEVDTKKMILTK